MDTSGRIHMTEELKKLLEKEVGKLIDDQCIDLELHERLEAYKKNVWPIKTCATIPDDAIPIDSFPDPKCKDCFGRGHITRIIENIRKVEPCYCVRNEKEKE